MKCVPRDSQCSPGQRSPIDQPFNIFVNHDDTKDTKKELLFGFFFVSFVALWLVQF
jgi:hypothetical protein